MFVVLNWTCLKLPAGSSTSEEHQRRGLAQGDEGGRDAAFKVCPFSRDERGEGMEEEGGEQSREDGRTDLTDRPPSSCPPVMLTEAGLLWSPVF